MRLAGCVAFACASVCTTTTIHDPPRTLLSRALLVGWWQRLDLPMTPTSEWLLGVMAKSTALTADRAVGPARTVRPIAAPMQKPAPLSRFQEQECLVRCSTVMV